MKLYEALEWLPYSVLGPIFPGISIGWIEVDENVTGNLLFFQIK